MTLTISHVVMPHASDNGTNCNVNKRKRDSQKALENIFLQLFSVTIMCVSCMFWQSSSRQPSCKCQHHDKITASHYGEKLIKNV